MEGRAHVSGFKVDEEIQVCREARVSVQDNRYPSDHKISDPRPFQCAENAKEISLGHAQRLSQASRNIPLGALIRHGGFLCTGRNLENPLLGGMMRVR